MQNPKGFKQLWEAERLAPREALAMALTCTEKLERQLREAAGALAIAMARIEELEGQLGRHITDMLDYWKQEAQK